MRLMIDDSLAGSFHGEPKFKKSKKVSPLNLYCFFGSRKVRQVVSLEPNLVAEVFGFSKNRLVFLPLIRHLKRNRIPSRREVRFNKGVSMYSETLMDRQQLSKEIASLIMTNDHSKSYYAVNDLFKEVRANLNLQRPILNTQGQRDRLTMDDFVKLLRAAYSHPNPQYGLMIKTLFQTGAREKSFRPLTPSSFKLIEIKGERKPVVSMDTDVKFDRPYSVPITWQLYCEIKTFCKLANRNENEPIFQPRGSRCQARKAFSKTRLWEIVKELCELAEIDKAVSAHTIRFVVSQMLYDNGMPMDDIRVFLNHVNIATTKTYVAEGPTHIDAPYRAAMKSFSFGGSD